MINVGDLCMYVGVTYECGRIVKETPKCVGLFLGYEETKFGKMMRFMYPEGVVILTTDCNVKEI